MIAIATKEVVMQLVTLTFGCVFCGCVGMGGGGGIVEWDV